PAVFRPAGFAQLDDATTDEHKLYIADREAPYVHVLDTSDACNLVQEDPLLPVSFVDPARTVTTRKIAVSPLTIAETGAPSKRYLYAIDELDNGSVMIFDISQGSTDRTPILRPRSAQLPFEPPDRIGFDSPAQDVAFALRDYPHPTATTGTQMIGVLCDPDPNAPPKSPGTEYRPTADQNSVTSPSSPSFLRGIFGF